MADVGGDDISENLLQKHRRERKETQAQIQKLKHTIPKGDKKRKKEVGDRIAKLETNLNQKHEEELTALKETAEVTNQLDALQTKELDESLDTEVRRNKASKAQRRREKKVKEEKEREERIREQEINNLCGARNIEAEKMEAIIRKRGLAISEIPSDGNCLYNAVCHQLKKQKMKATNRSLRLQISQYMREHPEDFLPFLSKTETGSQFTAKEYEDYLEKIATTAVWGGQVEIRALAEVLNSPIEIIQTEGPSITVGEDKQGDPILLLYHRHAYGLGEHYNSVVERSTVEEEEDGFA